MSQYYVAILALGVGNLSLRSRTSSAGATMTPGALTARSAFVCDVGGGSTEIAVGSPSEGVVTASASFEIGAFVLAERHFRHDPPTANELEAARDDAFRSLAPVELPATATAAFATGGSARAVARLVGPVVGAEELRAALAKVTSSEPGVPNEHRRRSLPAGIAILDVLQAAIGLPLTVVPGGLREGVLLQLARAHGSASVAS